MIEITRDSTMSKSKILIDCKHGRGCYNYECKYSHPDGHNACKYGAACYKTGCSRNHPPRKTHTKHTTFTPTKHTKHTDRHENKNIFSRPIPSSDDKCKMDERCNNRNCKFYHTQCRLCGGYDHFAERCRYFPRQARDYYKKNREWLNELTFTDRPACKTIRHCPYGPCCTEKMCEYFHPFTDLLPMCNVEMRGDKCNDIDCLAGHKCNGRRFFR